MCHSKHIKHPVIVSHLLRSDVSPNLWNDSEDPGGVCLSQSYTSDKQFSKLRLLAIIGLPWPMTESGRGGDEVIGIIFSKLSGQRLAGKLRLHEAGK
jgi:hypothetical protein